ncbi:50S ribosomal protein L21 [Sphingobacteriaceae bacterium AH-315-L07]|nr:50S ribosomal protein L21 [Sphingobacteriaceae bacterium AH-315-L07]
MNAIVDIAGFQFNIEKDQELLVQKLEVKKGEKVEFDKVLLTDNKGKITVGAPYIKGSKVSATVIEHLKDDTVLVFKKKRRKGYRVKNGHRQQLSKIKIDSIK